jgi:hypothetical protein
LRPLYRATSFSWLLLPFVSIQQGAAYPQRQQGPICPSCLRLVCCIFDQAMDGWDLSLGQVEHQDLTNLELKISRQGQE